MKKIRYTVEDTFGCREHVPKNCPTFIERQEHIRFKHAVASKNIIVVYGESRQGKTWAIQRYCPNQCRIGCTSDMDIERVKAAILEALNISLQEISEIEESETKTRGGASVDFKMNHIQAGAGTSGIIKKTQTASTTRVNVDLNSIKSFTDAIKCSLQERYLVFDNFHYLEPNVQRDFCSLLKEFNYADIKVIIVGVWKEATKITSLASDLTDRCAHIDIGMWSKKDLLNVIEQGEKALNIEFSNEVKDFFCEICVNNIGIFKNFLQMYCLKLNIEETQKSKKICDDIGLAKQIVEEYISYEALSPLSDRIKNLSKPRRMKKDSKKVRAKIVSAILELVIEYPISKVRIGIPAEEIVSEIEKKCKIVGLSLQKSNILQELGLIHEREDNSTVGANAIPLFYYDKQKKMILILEPSFYVVKMYNQNSFKQIIEDIGAYN